MKSKIYSDLEVESLEKSPFVLEVNKKRFIHYDPLFKLWTILQRKKYPEKTCRELFEYAGFNTRYGMDYFVSEKTYAILLDCFKGKVFIDNKENQAMIYRFKIYKELKDLLMEEKENEKRCTSKNQ